MYSEVWTLEKVREGFEKFYELNHRYPTAYDIDDFDFLPSARQIQRRFGGLVKLRKDLGLAVENYGQGNERKKISNTVNKKGREYENVVFQILCKKFDEKFIHIEKPTCDNIILGAYDNKSRYDFYVYAKPRNFAIDVFGTDDARGVVKNMNMKRGKYIKLNGNEEIYFVYFGKNIDKGKVDRWMSNRRIMMPGNWKIIDVNEFKSILSKYSSYKAI